MPPIGRKNGVVEKPKVTSLAPWYGSNRTLGHRVGEALKGCTWVGVPFAGGMGELAHIQCRTGVANDLHRHVINLARVCADQADGPELYRRVRRMPFCPETLAEAQRVCRSVESGMTVDPLNWAEAYFVSVWMARSGKAGDRQEFRTNLSVRWEAQGGDSVKRYQSAVSSLTAWRKVFRRWTFLNLDAFDFLGKCQDRDGHGVYCDPPFPGPGDQYKHTFSEAQHVQLSKILTGFFMTRIVCRFYDHPLIRKLYNENDWAWHYQEGGRKMTNAKAPEILIIRNGLVGENDAAD